MKLHQSIPAKEYKKAIYVHYFGYGFTYINVVLGGILLVIGLTKLIIGELSEQTYVCLLGGTFLLFRPFLYVRMLLKNVLVINKESVDFNFEINDGRMEVTAGETTYSGPIKGLHSYRDKNNFILLYASKAQFFVLDKKQMSIQEVQEIMSELEGNRVKKR